MQNEEPVDVDELRKLEAWHEAEAKRIREKISAALQKELASKDIWDRMVWAAHSRCPCGAGLAYDPLASLEGSVFNGPLAGYWDCSAIILGVQDNAVKHTAKLPFSFWSIKSAGQPSAQGATTKPAERPKPRAEVTSDEKVSESPS